MYGIQDEVAAFCFDRAVATFGLALENELKESTSKAKTDTQAKQKHEMVLRRWLDSGDQPQKFKDPMKGHGRAKELEA